MRYFRPKKEILPPAQKRLWPELRQAPKLGLVLYGGTAIALRLGHRPSVDFDFFSSKPLDKSALNKAFPFIAKSAVLQDTSDTYTVLVPYGEAEREHVKVSFFGGIGLGRVDEPTCTEDRVLLVASLNDLMATKLKVLLQRVEAKDYRDIAAMVESGVDLSKGLATARLMFGSSFQPSESLKALVFFEGGDLATLSPGVKSTLIEHARKVRDLPQIKLLSHDLAPAKERGSQLSL